MEHKHEKGNTEQSLYEIRNMGPQNLPNFGTWEEGRCEIRNME